MSCGGEFDELSNNPLLLNSNSNGSNCSGGVSLTMLQQQQLQQSIVFGSQLVKKSSSTPYTDATQVSGFFFAISIVSIPFCLDHGKIVSVCVLEQLIFSLSFRNKIR